MPRRLLSTLIAFALLPGPLWAQATLYTRLEGNHWIDGEFLVTGDADIEGEIRQNTAPGLNFFNAAQSSFNGRICVGTACLASEPLPPYQLQIKSIQSDVAFIDTSTGGLFADHDWRLVINEGGQNGADKFAIENMTTSAIPLTIMGDAPDNALFVSGNGEIGLGTSLPTAELHIANTSWPQVRMELLGGFPNSWSMWVTDAGFQLSNSSTGGFRVPVRIASQAPVSALDIASSGAVGLGTGTPETALHVRRDDGSAALLIEETSTTPAPRQLLTLRNNGQTYFTLEDTSIAAGPNSGRQWNFQNLGGEFRVTTAPGGGNDIEMRLTTAGDMIIEGNYFAASGTELNVPDYVFDADYDLKPLSEVQAFIDTHLHLPGVPSAADINATGLNMTDMQMRLLKKVEELTLYTLDQQAVIADLHARLVRLEARAE